MPFGCRMDDVKQLAEGVVFEYTARSSGQLPAGSDRHGVGLTSRDELQALVVELETRMEPLLPLLLMANVARMNPGASLAEIRQAIMGKRVVVDLTLPQPIVVS